MDEIVGPAAARTSPAGYPDYANPELLQRIPLSARVVLDVGCGHGALGRAYLRRNPRARLLGIDADRQAASRAAARLTEIACVDVEAQPMPFAVPEGIDCLVYGDVLEHLRDPWALLAAQIPHLAHYGTVLVCMPNLEHWSLVLRLLNGSFDYAPQGLLDRSHLRWFTPRSMGQALQAAGLELVDCTPRPADPGAARRFAAAMAPGLQAIGVDPEAYFRRSAPLQFIWRARRESPPPLVLRGTALPAVGGVSEVRVMQPLGALGQENAVIATLHDELELPDRQSDAPHIAILHRPLLLGEAGLARVRVLLEKGYMVVSEFDDHPEFMAARGLALERILTFRAVHAVQTSTAELARVLRPENPEIAVFPNAVHSLPEMRNFADPDRLTFFFGALNREADWRDSLPAINAIARLAGERLRFSVLHDEGFFEALETPHKRFTPICDYASYLRLLGEAEIAFMPLADTPFNRAKSDLKFIEAAACRAVALASPVVYGKVVEDGATGMIFNDGRQLRAALLRLLAFPDEARRMADAARALVARERMLAYQMSARQDWYRSLWRRREELTATLRARVPALFDRERSR